MSISASSINANQCLALTRGVCPTCRNIVNAKVVSDGERVFLRHLCPEHQPKDVLIAADLQWYLKTVNSPQISSETGPRSPVKEGCPQDCGLCSWHESSCTIPVFSVTNDCNLQCPICFTYNRPDLLYYMSPAEMERIVQGLVKDFGPLDLVNITGGEPTMHPQIEELLAIAVKSGVGRVTINSNGIRLAEEEEFVRKLAGLGVYVILSFNTMDSATSRLLHGRDLVDVKLKALANLEKYNVPTTILSVAVKGLNEHELGQMAQLVIEKEFLKSLTIQNMTYTGQGGSFFEPRAHITIDEIIGSLCDSSQGKLKEGDFRPHPRSHPLCYSTCYVLLNEAREILPLARLLNPEEYASLLSGGYLLHPDENLEEMMRRVIDRLWVNGTDPGQLKLLKDIIGLLYPVGRHLSLFERQQLAEKHTKTIYIHSHMDADTFDLARICRCGDLVPQGDGRYIPACSYNMFYRSKDKRFWLEGVGV